MGVSHYEMVSSRFVEFAAFVNKVLDKGCSKCFGTTILVVREYLILHA